MDTLKLKNKNTFFYSKKTINYGGKILDISNPVVMGVLNITSDSFYDGGRYTSEYKQIKQTEKMIIQGAKIIDIGAVSTKPGAKQVSEKEEIQKLIPLIIKIRKKFPDICISADTYRASVAKLSVDNGANIINDISGGTFDAQMFKTIAKINVPYIIMHIQGSPQNMQKNPVYKDVVKEIILFFSKQIKKLKEIGVNDIIIDPGFGFGKTLAHNYEILDKLDMFKIFELPVLVGMSRKRMIYKLLNITPSEALNGTSVLNTIALLKGANILRVPDVKQAFEAIKITSALNSYNQKQMLSDLK